MDAQFWQGIRAWARRHSAQVIAATIGGAAVVVAAIISTDARRSQGEHESERRQFSAQLLERDQKIAELSKQLEATIALRAQEAADAGSTASQPTSTTMTATASDNMSNIETPPGITSATPITVASVTVRDILFKLQKCTLSNRSVKCEFLVTNLAGVDRSFELGVAGREHFDSPYGGAYFFDDQGNEYISSGARIANQERNECCSVAKILIPNVPMSGWVRVEGVDASIKTARLLRLKFRDQNEHAFADFRNVPVGTRN
ncbi:MAG TPA: hypothetical protein VFO89_05115 [Thermoanaerobaculia bacterium]|nr:hypothetical protein [Thermoanaerobaculia bacterium]